MAYWAFCRHQVGILYMIVVYLTPLALSECDILSPVSYSAEQYCANLDNVTILNVAQWECRYICIQKARCGGIKYSPLKGTCILLENCALTDESNPVIYTIISSTEGSECLEWLQFPEDRWVHTKYGGDINWKKVVRVNVDGRYYPGYGYTSGYCRATDGTKAIKPTDQYPCEGLRVKEGCTAAYVTYSAGEVIPPGAVVGGRLVDGRAMYVASFDNIWKPQAVLSGCYLEGSVHGWLLLGNYTVSRREKKMQLLVVL